MKKTKVTILGCGSFFIDKDHSAPAYLVQTETKNILIDCGPGTMNQLAKIGFDPHDLDYIFITHFHADHSSDLFPILMRTYLSQKYYGMELKKNLHIVGPKGMQKFVSDLCAVYQLQFIIGFANYIYHDFEPVMEFDDFSLETYPVTHLGVDAYALRFKFEDKVFAFSGDSEKCGGVENSAKNADLFIADCATPKKYPANAHMSTTQVGEVCRDNGVKRVILSHQVPPGFNIDMVSEVKEVWDGSVVLAKDLMQIDL